MPKPHSELLPAYAKVKAFVRLQIMQGTWHSGDAVPSEAALQQQFGVSRMTVNRALRELVVEGLVTRVQGSGTVVAELHRISSTLAVRDIHEEIVERGHAHTSRVVLLEPTYADLTMAQQLNVPTGSTVYHSVLVHSENGVPIQLEDRHVNPVAAPNYLTINFSETTPTHYLLDHAPLTEASYSIEASLASALEAKYLAIKRADPCLVMTRRTVSGPRVASLARLVYPGMRYIFTGNFQL